MRSATDHMIAEKDGSIGWMTFNNPARHNAISYEMRLTILEILADFERDEAIRVIVLKGAGEKSFVAGSDISQFGSKRATPEQQADYAKVSASVQDAYEALTKPLIAMIHGYCLGAGVGVALNADIRIASDNAQFGIPAGRLGIAYPLGPVKRLVDAVGPVYAKEMLLTARRFSADEAKAIGLVNHVVPRTDLEDKVREIAAMISANAPLSMQAGKGLVNEIVKDARDRDDEKCSELVRRCLQSEDYREGRTAFMEKRPPVWKGR